MFFCPPARAQKPKGHASAEFARAAALPSDVIKRLRAEDPTALKGALDDVRMAGKGGAAAVPAIVELLREGLPAPLTRAAIETLGDTESGAASEVVGWYTRHRNGDIRRAAAEALARTGGPAAIQALRGALSDPDPRVRAASAQGLGSLGAKDAVGELFVALEHGVAEAAAPIGALCAAAECERLLGKLGSLPFPVVTAGLGEILLRTQADPSEDLKLAIVAHVRELGTAEANRFLRETRAKWPPKGSARVKRALDEAVIATRESPGAPEDGRPAQGGAAP